MAEKRKIRHCSFCGKSADEVSCLISAPEACICDICVSLCSEIIKERQQQCTESAPNPTDKR